MITKKINKNYVILGQDIPVNISFYQHGDITGIIAKIDMLNFTYSFEQSNEFDKKIVVCVEQFIRNSRQVLCLPEKQIVFDVRCVWVINNFDFECYISGFEFTKINQKDIEIIEQVINRFSTEG